VIYKKICAFMQEETATSCAVCLLRRPAADAAPHASSHGELIDGELNLQPVRFESQLNRSALIDHVRGRFQMFIHRRITFPLIDKPVADAELKTKFFHVSIIGIEVLMVQHAGRHVDGVALIPVVALAADL
jgi:hypothetical protein